MTTEHIEQVKFVKWFRMQYPKVVVFAIPNGGARHPIVAKKMKAEGVLRGVPDLFIPQWKLWIEMKKDKTQKPTQAQLEMMDYLELHSYTTMVAFGCDDAISKIKRFFEHV